MSPKSVQRFWDNDMHKQQPKARRVNATRFRAKGGQSQAVRGGWHRGKIQEKLRFPLFSLAPDPFVGCIPHRLFPTVLEPGHERSIEPERIAAFAGEKAAHILGVAIGFRDGRGTRNRIRVPVERFHRQSLRGQGSDAANG
ncbi:hypothetical protein DBIPINDM_005952 [Mesorhizobium sp. AR02]|nr:hypothetical protein DBIPINDM_005952 [Mesorhizobium sp. AR02]